MRMCPLCVGLVSVGLSVGAVSLMVGAGATPAPAAPLAADAFNVDSAHSGVVFMISHNKAGVFPGMFHSPSGTFAFEDGKPEATAMDVTLKLDNLASNNAKRDQHLKSPDFFSAKEFPTITFKSKSAKAGSGKAITVEGDLTMHGVTKPITATVVHTGTGADKGGKPIVGLKATFTVKRSDFGMTFMNGPLGDEVEIIACLEGGK